MHVFSQDCSIFPNTGELIRENHVSKQIIRLKEGSNPEYILEVLFFDETGQCYKRIYRDQSGYSKKYYISSWKKDPMRTEYELSYYDEDSNEIMISHEIMNFDTEAKRPLKREYTSKGDSTYYTNVEIYKYDSLGNHLPADIFRITQKRDTIEKTFTVNIARASTWYRMVRKNNSDKNWKEKEKRISTYDDHKNLLTYNEFKDDNLITKRSYKYRYENGIHKETEEYNKDAELERKTIFFDRGHDTYIYEKGKLINTYHEELPYADPVDHHDVKLPEEIKERGKKKKSESASPVKKLHQPKVVEHYRDPVKKDVLLMTESFDEKGLIRERNVIRDNSIYTWEYEFRS